MDINWNDFEANWKAQTVFVMVSHEHLQSFTLFQSQKCYAPFVICMNKVSRTSCWLLDEPVQITSVPFWQTEGSAEDIAPDTSESKAHLETWTAILSSCTKKHLIFQACCLHALFLHNYDSHLEPTKATSNQKASPWISPDCSSLKTNGISNLWITFIHCRH